MDEGSGRPVAPQDRLAEVRRSQIASSDEQLPPMTPALGGLLIRDIQSGSAARQITALRRLKITTQRAPLGLKDLPITFIPDLIEVFVREVTDHEIRIATLRLIELMCGKTRELLGAFSDNGFHRTLFEMGILPRSALFLNEWLPVIHHFLKGSAPAFAYFAVERRLLSWLGTRWRQARTALDIEFVVLTLSVYASSPFFNGPADPDSVFWLVEVALEILDPEILLKPTHLTGYAVRIIGCCLYKLQEGEYITRIIERNIAILIVNLIGPDNPQLAVDCSFFASLATYCSNRICFQLCAADVFNVIGGALREGGVFHHCGLNCLNALYNCLVACPDKVADAFESEPLREVLMEAIESGSAKVKQAAIDIVSFLIVTANLPNVIDYAKRFGMFAHISLVIELGLSEIIPHALAAANRIIEALEIAPHHVGEARAEMATKDVIDALMSLLESTAEPQVQEYARAYLAWASR